MRLKPVMVATWIAVGLVALGLVATLITVGSNRAAGPSTSGRATDAIGGPFTLAGTDGEPVTEADFRDKPTVLFFGFTHCPDVCPTTLYEMSGYIEALGETADALDFAFVTVDPERDTPKVMGDYLSAFDPRIEGLTGTPDQIAAMTEAYKIYYEKVPTENGYTMNHTASVYLMDAGNRLADTIAYGAESEVAMDKLRALASGS